jgi:hypothetical protein
VLDKIAVIQSHKIRIISFDDIVLFFIGNKAKDHFEYSKERKGKSESKL